MPLPVIPGMRRSSDAMITIRYLAALRCRLRGPALKHCHATMMKDMLFTSKQKWCGSATLAKMMAGIGRILTTEILVLSQWLDAAAVGIEDQVPFVLGVRWINDDYDVSYM